MRKRLLIVLTILLLVITVPVVGLFWFYESNFARTTGEFFDSDGVKIHYTVQGAGDPVILVHGFAFNADLNWRGPGVIDALAKQYQVVAIDNRGHGLSDKPHDPAAYGENMPRDIIRLMDHLGIEKAHVVGYSMGGFITLKLATLYPERLLSAAPCGMGWGQLDEETSALVERIASSLEEGRGFGPLLERLNIEVEDRGTLGRLFNYMLTSSNDVIALAKVMRAMPNLYVTEDALRANQVPVLTIIGRDDPLGDGVEPLHATMANHELVYLDNADHVTALRHPGFIPAIEGWLAKNKAGSWAFDPAKVMQPAADMLQEVVEPGSTSEETTEPAAAPEPAEALPDAA